MSEDHVDLVLLSLGKYPLYNVSFRIVDAGYIEKTKEVLSSELLSSNIGDVSPPNSARTLGRILFKSPSDHQELNVFFSGKNGWWTEIWRLQKVNGQWEHAIVVDGTLDVQRYPKGAILKREVSKGYPQKMIAEDKDWQRLIKTHLPQAVY